MDQVACTVRKGRAWAGRFWECVDERRGLRWAPVQRCFMGTLAAARNRAIRQCPVQQANRTHDCLGLKGENFSLEREAP